LRTFRGPVAPLVRVASRRVVSGGSRHCQRACLVALIRCPRWVLAMATTTHTHLCQCSLSPTRVVLPVNCCWCGLQAILDCLSTEFPIVVVNEYFSSQICAVCMPAVPESVWDEACSTEDREIAYEAHAAEAKLVYDKATRTATCPRCSRQVLRDVNAAQNLAHVVYCWLAEGRRPRHLDVPFAVKRSTAADPVGWSRSDAPQYYPVRPGRSNAAGDGDDSGSDGDDASPGAGSDDDDGDADGEPGDPPPPSPSPSPPPPPLPPPWPGDRPPRRRQRPISSNAEPTPPLATGLGQQKTGTTLWHSESEAVTRNATQRNATKRPLSFGWKGLAHPPPLGNQVRTRT
jgi:hypothetical protein